MNNEFSQYLIDIGVCDDWKGKHLKWSDGKSLREAYLACKNIKWVLWFLEIQEGKEGWPNRQELTKIYKKIADIDPSLWAVPNKWEKDADPFYAERAALVIKNKAHAKNAFDIIHKNIDISKLSL